MSVPTRSRAITHLAALDAKHVLHPHAVVGAGASPVIFQRGEGAVVWDADGREYLDGTCGLWQCAVGHARPELVRVAAEQMARLEFYPSFWNFSNEPAIRLAVRLAELSPDGFETTFFTNGGSEGIESAVKIVRRAWHLAGCPDRTVILSRVGAYHGVGAASLALTGIRPLKDGWGPLAPDVVHLSLPKRRAEEGVGVDELLDELERTIADIGAHRIAAFVGEPVLGVGGCVVPPDDYWPRVQEVLRAHGVMLIVDEVITGFGRTGHWFGAQRFGVEPDVIVTAKALSSGYVPMGAVLLSERVVSMLEGHPFPHGFTYNGHPVGAAVALENLRIIEQEGLLDHARSTGEAMLEQLEEARSLSCVVDVRGCGLMLGVELDGLKAPDVEIGARTSGVIVRGLGTTVVMSPPLIVSESQARRIVDVVLDQLRQLDKQ